MNVWTDHRTVRHLDNECKHPDKMHISEHHDYISSWTEKNVYCIWWNWDTFYKVDKVVTYISYISEILNLPKDLQNLVS